MCDRKDPVTAEGGFMNSNIEFGPGHHRSRTGDEPKKRSKPLYQREPEELRDQIWTAREITPLQLFRVVAWKSAKGLASVTLNSEADIERWSSNALDATSHWRTTNVLTDDVDWDLWERSAGNAIGVSKRAVGQGKETGLLALDGIGYPVASAILSFLLPNVFPVIDKWTVLAIYGPAAKNWERKAVYRNFAERLVEISDHFPGCGSIHQVDQALMNAVMDCPENPPCHACVPFEPISVPGR
jgi:hypothetical protein